jgi:hypothetical protein
VNNNPGEECSGEEFSASGEFFFERRNFRQGIIRAKNSTAKNQPSEELSSEESSGKEFS